MLQMKSVNCPEIQSGHGALLDANVFQIQLRMRWCAIELMLLRFLLLAGKTTVGIQSKETFHSAHLGLAYVMRVAELTEARGGRMVQGTMLIMLMWGNARLVLTAQVLTHP